MSAKLQFQNFIRVKFKFKQSFRLNQMYADSDDEYNASQFARRKRKKKRNLKVLSDLLPEDELARSNSDVSHASRAEEATPQNRRPSKFVRQRTLVSQYKRQKSSVSQYKRQKSSVSQFKKQASNVHRGSKFSEQSFLR